MHRSSVSTDTFTYGFPTAAWLRLSGLTPADMGLEGSGSDAGDPGARSTTTGGKPSPARGSISGGVPKKNAAVHWPPSDGGNASGGGGASTPQRARLGTDEYNRMEHGGQKGHTAGAFNPHGKLSSQQAYWHFMSLVLGLGTLTVPYALASLGWAGLILLGVLALMSTYTGILLCKCVDFVPEHQRKKRTPGRGSADARHSGAPAGGGGAQKSVLNTYPDIGEAAFGEQGRALVNFVLYVDLVASSALFLVFIATNLATLFPWLASLRGWLWATALSLLPTVWLQLQKLSFLSAFGTMVMVGMVVAILATAVSEALFEGGAVDLAHNEYHLYRAGSWRAAGNMVFAFACHGTLLTIYRDMQRPAEFRATFAKVYVSGFTIKTLVGATGYYLFAQNTLDQITLNLPHPWIRFSLTLGVTLKKWLTYALPLEPVAKAAEEWLLPNAALGDGGTTRAQDRAAKHFARLREARELEEEFEQKQRLKNAAAAAVAAAAASEGDADSYSDSPRSEGGAGTDSAGADADDEHDALSGGDGDYRPRGGRRAKKKAVGGGMAGAEAAAAAGGGGLLLAGGLPRLLLRAALVFLTLLVALWMPYFGLFQAVVGALCAGLLVLVFPPVFYLKLFWDKLPAREVYTNVALICVSFVLCGVATWDSIAEAYEMHAGAGVPDDGDAAAALLAD